MNAEHSDTPRVLTPSNVKRYMKQRGRAPLSDIINRFDAAPEAVLAILDFWRARQHIRQIAAAPDGNCHGGGSSCNSCHAASNAGSACSAPITNDLYEWIEGDAPPVGFDVLADYEQAWLPTTDRGI